jgi:hypothetical protein
MNFGTDLHSAYMGDFNSMGNMGNMGNGPVQEPLQSSNPIKNNQLSHQPAINNVQGVTMEEQVNLLKKELLKEKLKEKNSSLLSKFINKKREMIKIFVLSLVILLALSCHYLLKHYLKLYLLDNDLNYRKEFLLRFSYPLTIFIFIWIMKVIRSSDDK